MAILAIDPATVCGWALDDDGSITSGVWDLGARRGNSHRCRWLNLWERLDEIASCREVAVVAVEDVLAHRNPGGGTNVYAAHAYGAIRGVIEMWAEIRGARVSPVPVAVAKKALSGKGNASKQDMLTAARARWPEQDVRNHNQADAIGVLAAELKSSSVVRK